MLNLVHKWKCIIMLVCFTIEFTTLLREFALNFGNIWQNQRYEEALQGKTWQI